MRLDEFTKPDYENMSDEELDRILIEKLDKLEAIIDKSNNRIENEPRSQNPDHIRKIYST